MSPLKYRLNCIPADLLQLAQVGADGAQDGRAQLHLAVEEAEERVLRGTLTNDVRTEGERGCPK